MPDQCERCKEPALGYAFIGRKRYCHADERSCYTEQHHAETWEQIADTDVVLSIAARNAIRWRDALALLGRDDD